LCACMHDPTHRSVNNLTLTLMLFPSEESY
jgi:hypothetical protein